MYADVNASVTSSYSPTIVPSRTVIPSKKPKSPSGTPSYSPVAVASGKYFMNSLTNPAKPYYSFGYAVSVTKSYAIVGGPLIGKKLQSCIHLFYNIELYYKRLVDEHLSTI